MARSFFSSNIEKMKQTCRIFSLSPLCISLLLNWTKLLCVSHPEDGLHCCILLYLQNSFQYLESESGAILSLVFTTQSGLVITTFTQPLSMQELYALVILFYMKIFEIKWQLQAKKRTCRGRFNSLWFPSPKFYKHGFIKDNLQKHRMVPYVPKKSIG
jgi:hypothetical protein